MINPETIDSKFFIGCYDKFKSAHNRQPNNLLL